MNENTYTQPSDSAAMRQAARCLYESTPSSTFESVASEFGVSARTLKRWASADGGWRKLDSPLLTTRAHAAADRAKAVIAGTPPEQKEAQEAALAELRADVAVDERAQLLVKHRKQWAIVDGLVAEAVRGRNQTAAKLAEIVARTITLKQTGERKAWGMDGPSPTAGTVVVIDRDYPTEKSEDAPE
ncbi:hypothetical protein [Pseudomonas brassicacearum]|uniref:Terminase n=1 Tax=Pseudomonas brassicacearum TaxID=930166 RepID=A0A423H219_9PSED|nr:hypothetical protein [Pseudomonas brassicacearum]RON06231.1 hypothetical protein BK658_00120 [Pseudomonas brassicacearum]